MSYLDCGDSSCLFAENKGGMRTNGGCRCLREIRDFNLRMNIQKEILRLRKEINELKEQDQGCAHRGRMNYKEDSDRFSNVESFCNQIRVRCYFCKEPLMLKHVGEDGHIIEFETKGHDCGEPQGAPEDE